MLGLKIDKSSDMNGTWTLLGSSMPFPLSASMSGLMLFRRRSQNSCRGLSLSLFRFFTYTKSELKSVKLDNES